MQNQKQDVTAQSYQPRNPGTQFSSSTHSLTLEVLTSVAKNPNTIKECSTYTWTSLKIRNVTCSNYYSLLHVRYAVILKLFRYAPHLMRTRPDHAQRIYFPFSCLWAFINIVCKSKSELIHLQITSMGMILAPSLAFGKNQY